MMQSDLWCNIVYRISNHKLIDEVHARMTKTLTRLPVTYFINLQESCSLLYWVEIRIPSQSQVLLAVM